VTDPFHPPVESRPSRGWALVVAAWGIAGFTLGIAVGFTARVLGGPSWAATVGGAVGMVALAIAGAVVARMERWSAADRPPLVDGRGRPRQPVHAWVFAPPVLILLPSLAWLGAGTWLALGSPWAAAPFAAVILGLLLAVRESAAAHWFAVALQRLEAGEPVAGQAALEHLATRFWVPARVAVGARVNLGLAALSTGDLASANRWFTGIDQGPGGAWALTGLALVRVLDGAHAEAEALLADAMTGTSARHVQPQADAVRLLLVLRREGIAAASALGEHLLGPTSTALFRGLLASIRRSSGDGEGATALLTPTTLHELRAMGLIRQLPELAPLLRG
jgi:hypothetical protein